MTLLRIVAVVLFFAFMFGAKYVVHAVVDMGVIPWLIMMGAIFWAAIAFENRDRRLDGAPPYSWGAAREDLVAIRKEMLMPMSILAAITAAAYFLR
jgi:hypothetical protein